MLEPTNTRSNSSHDNFGGRNQPAKPHAKSKKGKKLQLVESKGGKGKSKGTTSWRPSPQDVHLPQMSRGFPPLTTCSAGSERVKGRAGVRKQKPRKAKGKNPIVVPNSDSDQESEDDANLKVVPATRKKVKTANPKPSVVKLQSDRISHPSPGSPSSSFLPQVNSPELPTNFEHSHLPTRHSVTRC